MRLFLRRRRFFMWMTGRWKGRGLFSHSKLPRGMAHTTKKYLSLDKVAFRWSQTQDSKCCCPIKVNYGVKILQNSFYFQEERTLTQRPWHFFLLFWIAPRSILSQSKSTLRLIYDRIRIPKKISVDSPNVGIDFEITLLEVMVPFHPLTK